MKTTEHFPKTWAWRLFAATAVVALAASVAQTAIAQPMPAFTGDAAEHAGFGPGAGGAMVGMAGMAGTGAGMGMMHGGRGAERLLDSVGASAEQKTQLKQIMDTARADVKPLREAAMALHRQMAALFAQPTVDARQAETLRQQLQSNREQVSKRLLQAMLDGSRVLSPEQRKQMADRMEQRRGLMQRQRAEREALEGGRAGQR
jgi:periplasmic protein CpxP/Spy